MFLSLLDQLQGIKEQKVLLRALLKLNKSDTKFIEQIF